MESIYTKVALYGNKYECTRTDTVFLLISEVCDGTVSLSKDIKIASLHHWFKSYNNFAEWVDYDF